MKGIKKWLNNLIFFPTAEEGEVQKWQNFQSTALNREVKVDVYLPRDYHELSKKKFPLLVFNDGQDMDAVGLKAILRELYADRQIQQLIIVAIHAGDRMHEYGTADHPDYKKRGSKAKKYQRFLRTELLPKLEHRYRISDRVEDRAIAGFSLGGLSAMDIAWNHPDLFSKVGVFSGSFWWRSQAFDPTDPDGHRIMHHIVEASTQQPELQFWFQTGTNDETEDRNNNGIIDSIDDTLDLIAVLKAQGYGEEDITYVEVLDGEHNPQTWGEIMPEFLVWAFG